jgi:hypothetical protein
MNLEAKLQVLSTNKNLKIVYFKQKNKTDKIHI